MESPLLLVLVLLGFGKESAELGFLDMSVESCTNREADEVEEERLELRGKELLRKDDSDGGGSPRDLPVDKGNIEQDEEAPG